MKIIQTRIILSADALEDRLTPTTLSAPEQYFLELINRARANPVAEATRYGIDLNEGLSPGTISTAAVQPLAPNQLLENAIDGHLSFLASTGQLTHTGSGGSSVSSRITAAGYSWTNAGENLAVSSGIGLDGNGAETLHRLLFVDENYPGRGHRVNLLKPNYKEVGSGLVSGTFQGFSAVYGGQDFGTRAGNAFLTGVAFTDAIQADRFYTVGEGISGVSIIATGAAGTFQTTTAAAGGYSLQLPAGTYSVTFLNTDGRSSTTSVTISSSNVKVDYIPSLATSPPPIAPPAPAPVPVPSFTNTNPSATLPEGSTRFFAVGADQGGSSTVRLIDASSGRMTTEIPTPGTTAVGARVATGDFNGDGVPDVVIGSGPGTIASVRVVDGRTQQDLFSIQPFGNFVGGVYVATGDINNDGRADLVITPDQGGGPRVRIFSGNGFTQIADFFGIQDAGFRGGARPGVGDLNGDGFADVIISAGFGGGPRISGYDGSKLGPNGGPNLFGDFFAFEQGLRNGAFITIGDIDGDGRAELIAGAGPGGGPRVTAFSGADLLRNLQTKVADFFAGEDSNRGGIRVAAMDLDGDGRSDLIVGSGPTSSRQGGSRVTLYSGRTLATGAVLSTLSVDAFPGFDGGVFVG